MYKGKKSTEWEGVETEKFFPYKTEFCHPHGEFLEIARNSLLSGGNSYFRLLWSKPAFCTQKLELRNSLIPSEVFRSTFFLEA